MANPVLAELFRNNWVENIHRGAFVVVDDAQTVVASAGDFERVIFPRSAIKSMQALALFKSGAVEKFNLNERQIAIACASHHGEPAHITAVSEFLEIIGCNENDLECGAHAPSNREARNNLFGAEGRAGNLHNNCSGKHAGMLAVAKAIEAPVAGYSERDHPVQKLVRKSVEEVLGITLSSQMCGTDGCSIPTWAAPLRSFAAGFAKMATGRNLDQNTQNATTRIFDAIVANPFLVGGSEVFDTKVMEHFGTRLVCKIGAQGVFCGAIRDLGLGFALKCDDGNSLAAQVMVAKMLMDIAQPNQPQRDFLRKRQSIVLKNWRKKEVAITKARA
ncbi:MAG: asparaginase [Devosiaceae bacterium]|nr:asparaginase [Devosiaceae bacterium]